MPWTTRSKPTYIVLARVKNLSFIDQAEKEDDLGDDQDEDEDDTSYDEYKSSRNKAIILIAILAVVAIVVIILFIRLHLNNKNDQY